MTVTRAVRGYLPGHFDLFHVGQLAAIRFARERSEHLVIGVASAASSEQIWSHTPIVALEERLEILANVRGVDEVVVHHEEELDLLGPGDTFFLDGTADWEPSAVEAIVLRGGTVQRLSGLVETASGDLQTAFRRSRSAGAVA